MRRPFCGAELVKAPPIALPPPPAHAAAAAPENTTKEVAESASVWWKRPNIIIPAVVGAVFVVLLFAVGISTISTQNAHRQAAADAARAAAAKKVADTKAATAQAMEPFLQLQVALKVGIVFADYTKSVQAAQFAVDSYAPSDANGRAIKDHLTNAATFYAAALDSWNNEIQNDMPGDKQTSWTSASAEVDQAKALVGSE